MTVPKKKRLKLMDAYKNTEGSFSNAQFAQIADKIRQVSELHAHTSPDTSPNACNVLGEASGVAIGAVIDVVIGAVIGWVIDGWVLGEVSGRDTLVG